MMISVSQNDTPVHQHDLVIEAAAKANLEVLVFTSTFRAKESDLPLAPIMKAAEEKNRSPGHSARFFAGQCLFGNVS